MEKIKIEDRLPNIVLHKTEKRKDRTKDNRNICIQITELKTY